MTISSLPSPFRSPSVGEAVKPRLMWLSRVRSCGSDSAGSIRTGKPGHGRAVGIPRVDVLTGGVDDLRLQVAVDVADRGVRSTSRGGSTEL